MDTSSSNTPEPVTNSNILSICTLHMELSKFILRNTHHEVIVE